MFCDRASSPPPPGLGPLCRAAGVLDCAGKLCCSHTALTRRYSCPVGVSCKGERSAHVSRGGTTTWLTVFLAHRVNRAICLNCRTAVSAAHLCHCRPCVDAGGQLHVLAEGWGCPWSSGAGGGLSLNQHHPAAPAPHDDLQQQEEGGRMGTLVLFDCVRCEPRCQSSLCQCTGRAPHPTLHCPPPAPAHLVGGEAGHQGKDLVAGGRVLGGVSTEISPSGQRQQQR